MKVKNVIAQLKKFDGELEVEVFDREENEKII